MHRGEIWWADLPKPTGRRPVLILTRDEALRVRDYVTVSELMTNIRRIPTEVRLKKEDGLLRECVVNLDVINTVPKEHLSEFIVRLSGEKMQAVEEALKFALDLSV
jgi:mRNA interferase MazF